MFIPFLSLKALLRHFKHKPQPVLYNGGHSRGRHQQRHQKRNETKEGRSCWKSVIWFFFWRKWGKGQWEWHQIYRIITTTDIIKWQYQQEHQPLQQKNKYNKDNTYNRDNAKIVLIVNSNANEVCEIQWNVCQNL